MTTPDQPHANPRQENADAADAGNQDRRPGDPRFDDAGRGEWQEPAGGHPDGDTGGTGGDPLRPSTGLDPDLDRDPSSARAAQGFDDPRLGDPRPGAPRVEDPLAPTGHGLAGEPGGPGTVTEGRPDAGSYATHPDGAADAGFDARLDAELAGRPDGGAETSADRRFEGDAAPTAADVGPDAGIQRGLDGPASEVTGEHGGSGARTDQPYGDPAGASAAAGSTGAVGATGATATDPASTGPTGPTGRDGHDGGAAAAGRHGRADEGERERLVATARAEAYGGRWDQVKVAFVDEPRRAVQEADQLVREVLDELHGLFAKQREDLERSLDESGDSSTEDLRVALRRYGSLFDRLLSV